MTMDFRKLLAMLNNDFCKSHGDCIWKVRVLSDTDRYVRIYNQFVDIDYQYDYIDSNGHFTLMNVFKRNVSIAARDSQILDTLCDYAIQIVNDNINKVVTVKPCYIRILDY